MNKQTTQSIRSITAIFWLGFFMSISFMETPLKFTAPNLSLAEGLQVGKIVFGALNKCEWVFLSIILISCLLNKASKKGLYLIAIISVILVIETTWLLPVLDAGVNRVISGQLAGVQYIHWLYILLEIIKVPVLLLIGLENYRSKVIAGSNAAKATALSNLKFI
jgi:hypothetical protein